MVSSTGTVILFPVNAPPSLSSTPAPTPLAPAFGFVDPNDDLSDFWKETADAKGVIPRGHFHFVFFFLDHVVVLSS
jgi:hypothetical protein